MYRKPVDRIGVFEHFWPDTQKTYVEQGHVKADEVLEEHFQLDMQRDWTFNIIANLDFEEIVLEETEETRLVLDGNGASLRRHKLHDTTPEHVDFTVKDRESWEEYKPYLLDVDERRINFESYRETKRRAAENNQFFAWGGLNVFESIHPICGHENMLIGMALDPEWVVDMAETYANLIINHQEVLFAKEGKPDGIFYYEDMGFKEKPFMSPAMYRELIQPAHKKTIAFNHAQGLPVIMHSCGFVEPLLPDMIDAGIDCLHAIEIKAGMDLVRIHKNFGDRLSFMGGIDVRALYSNDKAVIDKELESKVPLVKNGYNFVLHSDHSIPKNVEYDILRYYFDKGLELGQY